MTPSHARLLVQAILKILGKRMLCVARLTGPAPAQKSSVERSGAAQGLAEVLAVLGRSHVDALLPELLAACSSTAPFVREGSLTLFRFLPHSIPGVFQVRSATLVQDSASMRAY